MVDFMKGVFRYVSLLSLDVVLGSLASALLVLRVVEVDMPLSWWLVLPISVWVIYTADHLLDAYRLKGGAHTERHLFHHHHFLPIGIVWLFLLLTAGLVIPFFLPQKIIFFGYAMGGLVLLHLGLVWLVGNKTSIFLQKELGVGLIYCLGIWGGPYVLHGVYPALSDLLLFCQFFFLAMMNLLIFSHYEAATDELDGHTSLVRALGTKKAIWTVRGLWCINLAIGGYLLFTAFSEEVLSVQLVYLLMGGILIWINEDPKTFLRNENYRYWGDGAFIFPFILMLF